MATVGKISTNGSIPVTSHQHPCDFMNCFFFPVIVLDCLKIGNIDMPRLFKESYLCGVTHSATDDFSRDFLLKHFLAVQTVAGNSLQLQNIRL